jgi:hypothetical protein
MTLGVWMAFRYGRNRDREQTDHVNLELWQIEESRIREDLIGRRNRVQSSTK